MKIILSAFIFSLLISETVAQIKKINFEKGDWNTAVAKAKKENKMLLLYAFKMRCGPCKWIEKTVFANDSVISLINKTFISFQTNIEKDHGKDLKLKYKLQHTPSIVFVGNDGEMKHLVCKQVKDSQFVKICRDAQDPNRQLSEHQKKYNAGNRQSAFIKNYMQLLELAHLPSDKVFNEYFASLKEPQIQSAENWELMKEFIHNPYSKPFEYLETNKAALIIKFGKETVENKITEVFQKALLKCLARNAEKEFIEIKRRLKNSRVPTAEKIIVLMDMERHYANHDMAAFESTAFNYLGIYTKDYESLNHIGWLFYESVSEKPLLEKIITYMEKASSEINTYPFQETYASLLYKTGKLDEAKTWATKALETGKTHGADTSHAEDLLFKINNGN